MEEKESTKPNEREQKNEDKRRRDIKKVMFMKIIKESRSSNKIKQPIFLLIEVIKKLNVL